MISPSSEEEHGETVNRRNVSSKKRCERNLGAADGLENDGLGLMVRDNDVLCLTTAITDVRWRLVCIG
jgi:hypothetical protein